MKEFMRKYLNDEIRVDKKMFAAIMFGVMVFSGMYGMVYETIFYVFDKGAFCRRGSQFGPWIEIYAFGALMIYAVTRKFKKKPWAVFLLAGLVSGTFEYLAGWAIYTLFDGRRGWDYNVEIWNWGNINGFICLRSVLVFAVSGIMLMYVVYPLLLWISIKVKNKERFMAIMFIVGAILLVDVFYNDVIVSIFHTPGSYDFYKWTGWYQYYNSEKLF